MSTAYQQLINNLDYLKLNEMKLHLNEIIDNANQGNVSLVDSLIKLTNYEVDHKKTNAVNAMVKTGAFPHMKTIEDFDFDFQPTINKVEIEDLASLRFVTNNENIVFLGNSGTGKTHLATSIGIIAAKNRISTYFIKCNDLIAQLHKARLENRLDARIKNYCKYKVLIIDEIGYLPIDEEDAKLFFQLIDKRYETKSTIFTTNISFNNWDEVFKDTMIASAILDRVLHHAHVVTITGKSYRLKDYMKDDD
jgi:DNA replication protein DnaC